MGEYICFNTVYFITDLTCIYKHNLDTALQAERSRIRFPMVSLEYFIDLILAAVLSWGRLNL